MHTRSAITTVHAIIGLMIAVAIIVGAVAVLRIDTRGERSTDRTDNFHAGLEELRKIDPALIHYRQTEEIPVGMRQVRALAVGPDDRIYVGGDRAIHVFDSTGGAKGSEIALDDRPRCVAIGGAEHAFPGRIYVGMNDHVEVYGARGKPQATWGNSGQKALITSIAAGEEDVFVADAGNRIVRRYDTSGKLKHRIGARDDARKIPGFVIPSPYFDLAVAPDGLLRVVNPGALRVEAYTFDGDLERFWGTSASSVEGFFGCCNPAHFAILSDGRFVTAEKGIPRVKIYSAEGEFICVVVGPEQLPVTAADVAADSRDRVLILDPMAGAVRIFEHRQDSSGAER